MDTRLTEPEKAAPVQVAVFAKAPIPGYAKTRLIPAAGAAGAARWQRAFTKQAVRTAVDAGVGAVTLWCAPHAHHGLFQALRLHHGVSTLVQADGDLGTKMLTAFRTHCVQGPLILIGTDCPAMTAEHIRQAASVLQAGVDAVFCPAEDGGYALVGLRQAQPSLFEGMAWSTSTVMSDTLARAEAAGLQVRLLETLWDVDEPNDLTRLLASRRCGGRFGDLAASDSDLLGVLARS